MEYEKSGITGPQVEDDNPNDTDEAPETPAKPLSPAQEAMKAMLTGKPAPAEEDKEEEGDEEQSEKDAAPAETPPVEEGPEPKKEPEPATDPVKEPKFSQADIDRIIDGVIKKERSREDSALKRLRDLELRAGAPIDQLMQQVFANRVQQVVDTTGLDEETARRMVEQEEKVKRYEAEQERMQQEREEEKKVNTYITERNTWLADTSVTADLRAFAQKYAADIEAISDGGRLMSYAVARDYVLGQKLPEIIKAREEAAAAKAKQAAPAKAPVAASGKGPSTGPVLTEQQKRMAHELLPHLSKAEAEKRYAARLKERSK